MAATIVLIIPILIAIALQILGPIIVPEKKKAKKDKAPAYQVVNFDSDGGWQYL